MQFSLRNPGITSYMMSLTCFIPFSINFGSYSVLLLYLNVSFKNNGRFAKDCSSTHS
uniref:Uncharacterized protein n=1 Tax=Anguilla anguilla TaxID=7936 RepID=A0A0E9Q3R9_ANGAN